MVYSSLTSFSNNGDYLSAIQSARFGGLGEFSFLSKLNLCSGKDYSLPAALFSF